jgi:hypothetical protein
LATLFGGVVVVFLVWNQNYNYSLTKSIFIGISFYALCFFVIFIGIAFKRFVVEYSRLNEYNVYGESVIKLSSAFSIIHNLNRMEEPTFEQIIHSFEEFCTIIKQAFDELTMSQTSVCIKIVIAPKKNKDQRVITLCRDLICKHDREPKNGKVKHFIENNSCFQHFYTTLGRKKGKYYLNNNIVEDKSYKNSSFEYYGEIPSTTTDLKKRHDVWTLPYKSELVVPIAPLNSSNIKNELIGFLCVDSNDIDPFLDKYDPILLMGVADGVYNTMKFYNDKKILN